MACDNCTRTALSSFIRSLISLKPTLQARPTSFGRPQSRRCFSSTHHVRQSESIPLTQSKPTIIEEDQIIAPSSRKERPSWQVQKRALTEKFNGEAWNPRKKLSPDTMEGIRHLHKTQPTKFTTPLLANHFKVSPEAIRRILKSKWRPSDEEHDERMHRWDKRGERIWSNLVEMGIKPPKKWREMGVGRARRGEKPRWKLGGRNSVPVIDSADGAYTIGGDLIPVVDGADWSTPSTNIPLTNRL